MKIKKEFVLREIAGDSVLVPIGKTMKEYTGLFPVNDVGADIWKLLPEAESAEYIVDKLYEEYDVDKATLRKDVEEYLTKLRNYGII